jgi:hypothetical protein
VAKVLGAGVAVTAVQRFTNTSGAAASVSSGAHAVVITACGNGKSEVHAASACQTGVRRADVVVIAVRVRAGAQACGTYFIDGAGIIVVTRPIKCLMAAAICRKHAGSGAQVMGAKVAIGAKSTAFWERTTRRQAEILGAVDAITTLDHNRAVQGQVAVVQGAIQVVLANAGVRYVLTTKSCLAEI